MTPRLDTMLDLCKRATKGSRNAHRGGDCYGPEATVRGPFFRWLKVTEVDPKYKSEVADPYVDAQFVASCDPQTIEAMIELLKEAREIIESNGAGILPDESKWLERFDEFNKDVTGCGSQE